MKGKFLLPNVKTLKVWHLHNTIPGLLIVKTLYGSISTREQSQQLQPAEEICKNDHLRIRLECGVKATVTCSNFYESAMHLPNGVQCVGARRT